MFTGLVEEIGEVVAVARTDDGYDLTVRGALTSQDARLGDSIAVDGVCLTITKLGGAEMTFGLAPETRRRTALEALEAGSPANLERAVLPTTRLGGHFVQGHVDGVGHVLETRIDGDALWVKIAAPADLMKYIVRKGFISIDGTSLTVVNTGDDWFDVTLVAYTQAHIVLPRKKPGDPVNLEVDVLAKYVEKLSGGAA